uniref:Ankyrin repeat domain 37 n=1 Tax=Salvator merianae TaxID=96440 RepID=A0A8D0BS07_SALMN
MRLLDCNAEVNGQSCLLEAGEEVNIPSDSFDQSPVHLAARGGDASLLLWQLQTGANLNKQDWLGEAPIHKAAKVGSLECLTLLAACHASIDLRNKNGETAEDLARTLGYLDCVQFLRTVKQIQNRKAVTEFSCSLYSDGLLTNSGRRQKRRFENRYVSNKKARSNGTAFSLY